MLVVVENRDVQVALQFFLNGKALGAADVLQVDAAEGGRDGLDRRNDFFLGLGVDADGEGIHTAKLLEQDALAFHDRHGGLGADVPQAQHGGAVGDDGHHAALAGVAVDVLRVCLDLAAGLGDAGGVGGGQGVAVAAFHQALHRQFAVEFLMQFQRGFVVIHCVFPPVLVFSVRMLPKDLRTPVPAGSHRNGPAISV